MKVHIQPDPQNVFFRVVEDCNESIMISDMQGVLVYVNPAWQRIYGYTREEAIGKTPRLLHSGHQSAEFYREMWSSIRNPETGYWKGELINRAKDGRLVPVLLTITPFRNEKDEIIGHMGIALDISQNKELEAKVVHQDRLASIGMLASGLAHEVGTPLGVVRGRAEFLQSRSTDPTFQKNLEVIITQIDRISKLIRSLLRVSRSFNDVRMEPVSPAEVIQEVISLVGQTVADQRVRLEVSADPEIRVMADFGRLEQIILNLVMNASHAIRSAIGDGRPREHVLTIAVTRRHSKVAIEVRDTGCGIPPENMKKLFKPFFTTKQVGEGTGLGLAIVGQIVRELGGEISVHSVVNEGTAFTLVLDPAY